MTVKFFTQSLDASIESVVSCLLESSDTPSAVDIALTPIAITESSKEIPFRMIIERGQVLGSVRKPHAGEIFSRLQQYPEVVSFMVGRRVQLSMTSQGKLWIRSVPLITDSAEMTYTVRICWSKTGWSRPSESRKKEEIAYPHLQHYGFACEEWLFHKGWELDGYRYGFIEPVRRSYARLIGKNFNLCIYTISKKEEQRLWVGRLCNVQLLRIAEAKKTLRRFHEHGWIKTMFTDLIKIGIDPSPLYAEIRDRPLGVLNVRFKVEELTGLFKKPVPVSPNFRITTADNYRLANFPENAPWPPPGADKGKR